MVVVVVTVVTIVREQPAALCYTTGDSIVARIPTITLEVPADLADRLAALQGRLPDLLRLAVELESKPPTGAKRADIPAFREMIDFLAGGPTFEQILGFKVSPSTQERLEDLLDKNREGRLTADESAELDVCEEVQRVMLLLKARARSALATPV